MIDVESWTVVGQIDGGVIREVAISRDGSVAFFSTVFPNAVLAFSTETREQLDSIPVGDRPWDIDYAPDRDRLYIADDHGMWTLEVCTPGRRI